MKMNALLMSLLAAAAVSCECSGQNNKTVFRAGAMPKAPQIDGIVNENADIFTSVN